MARVGGDTASARPVGVPEAGPAPAVQRLRSSRWRDPRLAVGVVLVAASVVVGARVLAAADDTVTIWSLRNDVPAGSQLTSGDVTVSRVHFEDTADAAHYFDADAEIPSGLVVDHDLVAGELLARSALAEPVSRATSEVPVPLTDGVYPADLEIGDRIDIWVTPTDEAARRRESDLVFHDVPVLQADLSDAALSGTTPVVVVGLDSDQAASLDDDLTAFETGSVTLIRVGG
jgi:hypothetical protein